GSAFAGIRGSVVVRGTATGCGRAAGGVYVRNSRACVRDTGAGRRNARTGCRGGRCGRNTRSGCGSAFAGIRGSVVVRGTATGRGRAAGGVYVGNSRA